jgi:hypothetical protein
MGANDQQRTERFDLHATRAKISTMLTSRRHFVTGIIGAATGAVAFGDLGCSGDTPSVPVSDVIIEGGATQAAAVALLEAHLVSDPTQAASFTWTSNGDMFSASQPLTFCWTSVAGATLEPRRPTPRENGRSTLSRASEVLFTPLVAQPGVAHAQTPPLSGKAYFLVLSTSKNAKLVRVFTTNHDYSPTPAVQQRLAAAGVPIQAVVTTAYFNADVITKAGGPFQGNAVTFIMTA